MNRHDQRKMEVDWTNAIMKESWVCGWRPAHFGYSLWGCSMRLEFPVVKLLDYADRVAELEAEQNSFAAERNVADLFEDILAGRVRPKTT